jgi:leucyl/phenylalanyl-tRNA--protein transferase
VPVYQLSHELRFPPPEAADPSGLLAVGGDLSPKRLLLAYKMGIFPWYEAGLPILWHSPDPRMVLRPSEFRLSRSLRRQLRNSAFEIRLDTAFSTVIRACASKKRPEGDGTWITDEMMDGYDRLFELGYAHSAEAWLDDQLVGGLYGVSLGGCFFGESMFAYESNASKIAFATLVGQLVKWDFNLIDCQVHTDHLERFGATAWQRSDFLAALETSLDRETRRGPWRLEV